MAELEIKYYDPREPGSYAGLDKFYRHVTDTSRDDVKEWLQGQESYTLHKPIHNKFKRNSFVVSDIDSQWDIDLIDMIQYRDKNDNFQYIFVAIDILSRFAWTRALKNKTGKNIEAALRSIFHGGRKPSTIRTDRGSEFRNFESKLC